MSCSALGAGVLKAGEGGFPYGDRRRVILLGGLVLVLYALSVTSHWRFQRDSALYLGLGRSLGTGQGYTFNGSWCTTYPPGYPAIVCAVGSVFGFPRSFHDSFLALNLTQAAFALGSILLLALIVREMRLPRRLGWPVMLLWGVSRTLYYHAGQDMTDVPFVFLALLAVWAGLRMAREQGFRSWAWLAVSSAVVVAASAVRAMGPLLVPALLAELWLVPEWRRRWKASLLKSAFMAGVLVVPLAAWMLLSGGTLVPRGAGYFRGIVDMEHVLRIPRTLFAGLPSHLDKTTDAMAGAGLTAPVGLLLWVVMGVGVSRMVRRRQWAFIVYGALTLLVLFAAGFGLGSRHLLPVLPAMCCLLVIGADATGAWLQQRWPFWTSKRWRRVALGGLILLVGTNVARDGKVILEARSTDFYAAVESGRGRDYAVVTDWLREHADRGAAVFCYEATTVHYFTGLRTHALPKDTSDVGLPLLRRAFVRDGAQYVITDARKEGSSAVIYRLREEAPKALTPVMTSGRVELLRVALSEFPDLPPAGHGAARMTPPAHTEQHE
jgi:hypothetical protein